MGSVDSPIPSVYAVYPNPVKGELVVHITGITKEPIEVIQVIDLLGRRFHVTLEATSEPGKYTCYLGNLLEGVYFIWLLGQPDVHKIVKVNQ